MFFLGLERFDDFFCHGFDHCHSKLNGSLKIIVRTDAVMGMNITDGNTYHDYRNTIHGSIDNSTIIFRRLPERRTGWPDDFSQPDPGYSALVSGEQITDLSENESWGLSSVQSEWHREPVKVSSAGHPSKQRAICGFTLLTATWTPRSPTSSWEERTPTRSTFSCSLAKRRMVSEGQHSRYDSQSLFRS